MQVISGSIGRQRVGYKPPAAARLATGMAVFPRLFQRRSAAQSRLKEAIAHRWFVTIHHFDDGNGGIARDFDGAEGIFGTVLRKAVFFGNVRQ